MELFPMVPSGYPGVVRDGLDALEWVARLQRRFAASLSHTESDPAAAPPPAPGEGIVWTPESLTQAQSSLDAAIQRVRQVSDIQWTSGSAASYFTPVELDLIERWGYAAERIPDAGGELTRADRSARATQVRALVNWLDLYLAQNGE